MNFRVRRPAWLLVAAAGAICLFVLGAQPVAVGLFSEPWDKLAHAIAFGILFLVLDRALAWPKWLLVALPLLVSFADELHQLWLPGRQPGVDDWLAGAAGVACMFCLIHFLGDRLPRGA